MIWAGYLAVFIRKGQKCRSPWQWQIYAMSMLYENTFGGQNKFAVLSKSVISSLTARKPWGIPRCVRQRRRERKLPAPFSFPMFRHEGAAGEPQERHERDRRHRHDRDPGTGLRRPKGPRHLLPGRQAAAQGEGGSKVPVQEVIDAARKALYTGQVGDGKFFVMAKVRTGEVGYDAL